MHRPIISVDRSTTPFRGQKKSDVSAAIMFLHIRPRHYTGPKKNRTDRRRVLIVNDQKEKLRYTENQKTNNPNYYFWISTIVLTDSRQKKQCYNVCTLSWNTHRMHSTRLPTKRAHWLQMNWKKKLYIGTQMPMPHTYIIYIYILVYI